MSLQLEGSFGSANAVQHEIVNLRLETETVPTFQSFEDIKAWQEARQLSQSIYSLTKNSKFSKDYGFCDQIRRSSVSVMSNIAEGFGRGGSKEFIHFLSVARGSLSELKNQVYIAEDQQYISVEEADSLKDKCDQVSKLLWGLIQYLKNSNCYGIKYK